MASDDATLMDAATALPSSDTTSAATLLSSYHGQMRSAKRQIAKRDLQTTLKHGTRGGSINRRGELTWKKVHFCKRGLHRRRYVHERDHLLGAAGRRSGQREAHHHG